MTGAPLHRRILASAGSGKTYALTTRYLELLAAGVTPDRILATTFTRLAAGEILEKLLARLVDAADDADARRQLGAALGRPLTEADVVALLGSMARQVHRVQIRTLDSLFGQIARVFAPELGLAPDVRVLDEVETFALQATAVNRTVAGIDPERFIALLTAITQGAADKAIAATVERQVKDLAEFAGSDASAWGEAACGHRLERSALEAAVRRLRECPVGKRVDKTRCADVESAAIGDWDAFVASGLARRILKSETYYSQPIDPDLAEAYRPLIAHGIAVVSERRRHSVAAARDLVEAFVAEDSALKDELGALSFADVTLRVGTLPRLDDLGSIGYRLDALFDHVLLDEFQDTSIAQWTALAPMLGEIVGDASQPRSLFCVGDVKQSIYGWRGAEPELLQALPTLLLGDAADAIEASTLTKSWRSAPPVVDAVNRICGDLPATARLIADVNERSNNVEALLRVAPHFPFDEHTTARTALSGAVELRTSEAEWGEKGVKVGERRRRRMELAAAHIADLHRRHPEASIGVLTRSNAGVARLVAACGPGGHRLPVSGRGGTELTDAAVVGTVLDLLLLADDPEYTAGAFHVGTSPLAAVVGLEDWRDKTQRRAVAERVRDRLVREGYGVVLDDWSRRLVETCGAREFVRLRQLVDQAVRADSRPNLRPRDFVRAIEKARIPTPYAAPIQVMTVHAAKGLEFDFVVLPELEWRLVGPPPGAAGRRAGTAGPVERIVRWVKRELAPFFPEAAEVCGDREDRTLLESLCLLYVALTRAKQGLILFVDPKDKLSATPEGLVCAGLLGGAPGAAEDIEDERPGRLLFQHGDATWIAGDAGAPPVHAAEQPVTAGATVALGPSSGRRAHAARSASDRATAAGGMRAWLRLPDDDALERGTAVHGVLEAIEWGEDGVPAAEQLESLLRTVAPRRKPAWRSRVIGDVMQAIRRPNLARLLSRALAADGGPGPPRVWRERRFARWDDGRIQRGIIDRLVAATDAEGRPIRAWVVDFKTDPFAADPDAVKTKYAPQLDDYRRAAADLLELPEADVRTILISVADDTRIDVHDGPAAPEPKLRPGAIPVVSPPDDRAGIPDSLFSHLEGGPDAAGPA